MNRTEELEEKFGAAAFKKFPLTIVKGKGSLVWDADGKEYIDFAVDKLACKRRQSLMATVGKAIVKHRSLPINVARLVHLSYEDGRRSYASKRKISDPRQLFLGGRRHVSIDDTEGAEESPE